MRRQKRRESARPRPVPPNSREVVASACEKSSKRTSWASAEIPIPVSETEKAMMSSGVDGIRETETEIVVAADAAPVVPLMQPLPPAPEVVAVPEPAPKSKSSKSKTSKSKTSSSKSSSDDSKRKNPLILGDFDGNPLG